VAISNNDFKIFLKGVDETNTVESYQYMGMKCRVTFRNGKSFDYNSNNVKITESCLKRQEANDCFMYLSELARVVGISSEMEDGRLVNFLDRNYSNINFVDPESVFGEYLSGRFLIPVQKNKNESLEVIYPFGFNISQKGAIDNALNNRLSIIEGPPGTGKTQTILNILGNIVMRGESVAVVSSNNSAVRNVLDKLEKNNLDFFVALLGNKENKNGFIKSQETLPSLSDWELSENKILEMKNILNIKHAELEEKLKLKIELSNLKLELSNIELEEKHFVKFINNQSDIFDSTLLEKIKDSSSALDAWISCEYQNESHWVFAFAKFIIETLNRQKSKALLIHKGLKHFSREQLIQFFQHQFYKLKILELNSRMSKILKELEAYEFDKQMIDYSVKSMRLFKAHLATRYNTKERKLYDIDDLWKNPDEFIHDYPIILSTAYSLKSSVSSKVCYDYLIIDESSQVDLCTGALALSCARNVVVVGDLKQLPHVVDPRKAKSTDDIFAKYKLSECYRFKNQSLLSSILLIFTDAPRIILREHYRCSPKIIDFCNKKFYDGQLIIMTDPIPEKIPLIVYKTVPGNHERNRMNQRQIDMIKEEIIPDQSLNMYDNSIGIVTPFRNQTHELQKVFEGTGVKADTVDKFQGQERDIIILSTVNDDITEFADNENRLNVAVSRAIHQLIVVVNETDSLKDTNIGDLVRYIEYNKLAVIESKVQSVFDLLYSSYSKKRREYLSQSRRISNFDSENLMQVLIEDVLREDKFKKLGCTNHVQLNMIIKEKSGLTSKEFQYASHYLSHVDFLIYEKMGKVPMLAIEVDGVAFHKEGSLQGERDELKNSIFLKCGIPLLRFKTNGSMEKNKLIEVLEELCL